MSEHNVKGAAVGRAGKGGLTLGPIRKVAIGQPAASPRPAGLSFFEQNPRVQGEAGKARRGTLLMRVFGLRIQPEMLALWLLETGAGFLTFYVMLDSIGLFEGDDVGAIAPHLHAIADALLMSLTVGFIAIATGLYRPQSCVAVRLVLLKAGVSAALSLPAVWIIAAAMNVHVSLPHSSWPGWPVAILLGWTALILATRMLYRAVVGTDMFVRRVAVLGTPQLVAETVGAIHSMRYLVSRVEAIEIPVVPGAASAGQAGIRLPKGLWGVVTAGAVAGVEIPSGVRRFDAAAFWEDQLGRVDLSSLPPPDAQSGAAGEMVAIAPAHWLTAAVRRLLDIVVASLLLLLTAPLLLAVAISIRLESPGPAIYRQERVGLGGKSFTLWKLRSMRQDAEKHGPRWAAARDPRVTAIGRVIRQVRIDELPQLINILRGDISLIGPRPERPNFVEQLATEIPCYRERHAVKPGLTGWAQVSYPYGSSVEDAKAKLSYDLYYIKNRNLLFDMMILLSTVRVILFQEGAR